MKTQIVQVPVDAKMKEFLRHEARESMTSVAAIVRVAIKKYMEASTAKLSTRPK